MYKTELHLHNAAISRCAHTTDEEIVARYEQAGYTTLVLTNHFSRSSFKARDYASYEDFVHQFWQAGPRLEALSGGRLRVLTGAEVRFDTNNNDYLVFGATEAMMLENQEIFWCGGLRNFRPFADEHGLLVYQAHPFRDGMTVVKPEWLDGMEVFNGHPGHDARNPIALLWAECFGLRRISGTDRHNPDHDPVGGIVTDQKIETMDELVRTLRVGNYTLLTR